MKDRAGSRTLQLGSNVLCLRKMRFDVYCLNLKCILLQFDFFKTHNLKIYSLLGTTFD